MTRLFRGAVRRQANNPPPPPARRKERPCAFPSRKKQAVRLGRVGFPGDLLSENDAYARSKYLPVRVSTLIRSPLLMKSGT